MRPCHRAPTMINLDHWIMKMFVKDNIYWKFLSLAEKWNVHEACHRALTVRPAIDRPQLSIQIIRININFHTSYPSKILITPIGESKTYWICHSFSLRMTKYFNPYKKIFTCNISHTLQHKIQLQIYMEINSVFVIKILSARNLTMGC